MCACVHANTNFGGQSHLQESILSKYVGHGDGTQAVNLDCKYLYMLNHIAGPMLLLETNTNGRLAMTI